jgi:hypothetical protein
MLGILKSTGNLKKKKKATPFFIGRAFDEF